MPLTDTRRMLNDAMHNHYAVGAFNIENMETAQAVAAAAEKMRAPVIMQTSPSTVAYASPGIFAGMIAKIAAETKVPVALHLDHGGSLELCRNCIEAGFTSVMIDGSALAYHENVALTKSVVTMAGDLPVEAELGTVGGKEDNISASVHYTDPDEAAVFVKETGISSFAPAIGTAHGIYKSEPVLDMERLSKIREKVDVPLVLHGTSGIADDQVREMVARGICKVNYATELRLVFSAAVKEYIAGHGDVYDPKKYLAAGRDAVAARVCSLIEVLGSAGRAE